MTQQERNALLIERMRAVRQKVTRESPYFGELLLNLRLAAAEVGTAATDGKNLLVDPAFAERLSDGELSFIFMHEVMHVVFQHLFRRDGRDRFLWNLACDLTVNSNILAAEGIEELRIDGRPVMHRIGLREAYLYTADEIYAMLLKESHSGKSFGVQRSADALPAPDDGSGENKPFPDSHEVWDWLSEREKQERSARFRVLSREAAGRWCGTDAPIPQGALKQYRQEQYRSQLRWKEALRDFLRNTGTAEDWGFRPPDRRLSEEEFLYPGPNICEGDQPENVWFFVDRSGSVSRRMLMTVSAELTASFRAFPELSGLVSFFDVSVTAPISFSGLSEYLKIELPAPSGGTSFQAVFQYVRENRKRYDPCGLVILTDGRARYPESDPFPGLPVLWIIADNECTVPPFGRVLRLRSAFMEK